LNTFLHFFFFFFSMMDERASGVEGRRSKRLKRDSGSSSLAHPSEGGIQQPDAGENKSKGQNASISTNDVNDKEGEEEDVLEDDLCPICRLLLCNPSV
jgi:hypothetical protein